MFKFSIIIPVFQNHNIFSLFIHSLLDSLEEKTQIILINDASPEEVSKEICNLKQIRNNVFSIQTITHETSMGCAKSINEAFLLAKGEFIVLMDSDVIVKKNWQKTVIKSFSTPEIGCVGGVLLYPQTNGIQCCGITYTCGTGRHLKLNAPPESVGNNIYEVQASVFAFLTIKIEVINKIGFLNDQFFNGYEDWDYQMRIRQAGYKIIINPIIQFYHWEKSNGVHRAYNRKSNLGIFWKKHGYFIKEDLWDFIFPQINRLTDKNDFIGIDICSSRLDAETFWRQAAKRAPGLISDFLDYSYQIEDNKPIWLLDILHYDFFRTSSKFLFLCDNFVQLTGNYYWIKLRERYCQNDIIVDLYGNVISFMDLTSTCWPGNKIR